MEPIQRADAAAARPLTPRLGGGSVQGLKTFGVASVRVVGAGGHCGVDRGMQLVGGTGEVGDAGRTLA